MRVLAVRSLFAVLVVSIGLVMGACEKPDASHTTSPSARLLLGLTTGRVLYHIPELPPEPVVPPAGWAYELGNARYEKLENGTHAILVVGQVTAKIGPDVEIWLADKDETVAKWFGGSSHGYDGVICWQQKLEAGGQALVLKPGRAVHLDGGLPRPWRWRHRVGSAGGRARECAEHQRGGAGRGFGSFPGPVGLPARDVGACRCWAVGIRRGRSLVSPKADRLSAAVRYRLNEPSFARTQTPGSGCRHNG